MDEVVSRQGWWAGGGRGVLRARRCGERGIGERNGDERRRTSAAVAGAVGARDHDGEGYRWRECNHGLKDSANAICSSCEYRQRHNHV